MPEERQGHAREIYVPAPQQQADEEERVGSEGFREKLIMQGIISGIILMAVLILRLTDHPQAAGIRTNLSHALAGNITVDQMAAEAQRVMLAIGIGESAPAQAGAQYSEPTPPASTRIDESVLRDLSEWTDDLQTTAPDPIVIPEL
jgi:hypothetical protein